jgi:hypothetical protein
MAERPTNVNALRGIQHAVFPAMELVMGMGIAQLIATAQVYFSNRRLYEQITAVASAGFLPVPNLNVLPRLLDLETAFAGGLLFTLSVGAALSLLSAAAAMIWRHLTSNRRLAAAAGAAVLAGAVICLNLYGFDIWVSLYVVAIPPAVFWMAARSHVSHPIAPSPHGTVLRFLPLAVLAIGWYPQYDSRLFIDLRDHLLMSNSLGKGISAFYYRYTLYPAEVFKTLDQRLIKPVTGFPAESDGRSSAVMGELIRRDYLPVEDFPGSDISVRLEGGRLAFRHRGDVVWENTTDYFLADSRRAVSEISARADRFKFFRGLTYYGVLLAFPIALYVLLFALLRLIAGMVTGSRRAEALTAAACLLIGLAILADFHRSREDVVPPAGIGAALDSDRWQKRVAGLQAIGEHRFDIVTSPGYGRLLNSPYPQERYWLAHALGASPNPRAFNDLIRLLNDPQINVRTKALEGLAQRRDPRAVSPILRLLKASHEWYDQLYAYQALRTLRWNQTRLH